jgi:hypothetical protein
MDPVRQTQKKYGSRAMTVAILVGLAFIVIGYKPAAKGLILGTIFSVINFVLIGQTLPLRLSPSRSKSSLVSLFSIAVRYAVMAVPLVLAVKMEQLNIAAVICGLFMVQLVILADHLFAGNKAR